MSESVGLSDTLRYVSIGEGEGEGRRERERREIEGLYSLLFSMQTKYIDTIFSRYLRIQKNIASACGSRKGINSYKGN